MIGVICTRLKVVLGMWLLQYAGSDLALGCSSGRPLGGAHWATWLAANKGTTG